jgi:hypothetical protein
VEQLAFFFFCEEAVEKSTAPAAAPPKLLVPSAATLAKYGLSLAEWQAMADAQGHACWVCQQVPTKGRLCIDHVHVKDWRFMAPEHRKLWVRGLLCYRCNTTFVGRGVTVERSRRVTLYLQAYEARRPAFVHPKAKKAKKKSKKKSKKGSKRERVGIRKDGHEPEVRARPRGRRQGNLGGDCPPRTDGSSPCSESTEIPCSGH